MHPSNFFRKRLAEKMHHIRCNFPKSVLFSYLNGSSISHKLDALEL